MKREWESSIVRSNDGFCPLCVCEKKTYVRSG